MDARTRELERRWQQSGDRAAGVRYLQALVRSGAWLTGRDPLA